jgi:hypothetical protein
VDPKLRSLEFPIDRDLDDVAQMLLVRNMQRGRRDEAVERALAATRDAELSASTS